MSVPRKCCPDADAWRLALSGEAWLRPRYPLYRVELSGVRGVTAPKSG